jgi:hypothetical protein
MNETLMSIQDKALTGVSTRGVKLCIKCGIKKDITEFGKDSNRKDGLFVYCKSCRRESGKRYREELKIRNSIKKIDTSLERNQTKRCPRCGLIKDVREFGKSSFRTDGLQAYCKPCKTWQIDHKTPQSVFSFTSHESDDFKQCWGLDNLQALWTEHNLSKNDQLGWVKP